MDPTHETPSDAAGEHARETTPPQRSGPTTPAPPIHHGPDVNDIDRLEDGTDRFLGERTDYLVPTKE